MVLNYKLVCCGVRDTDVLDMLNTAMELQGWKEPTPQQMDVMCEGIAIAAKYEYARRENNLLFWHQKFGKNFPYPDALNHTYLTDRRPINGG